MTRSANGYRCDYCGREERDGVAVGFVEGWFAIVFQTRSRSGTGWDACSLGCAFGVLARFSDEEAVYAKEGGEGAGGL